MMVQLSDWTSAPVCDHLVSPHAVSQGRPSKVGWQVGRDTCRCYLFVPI